MAEPLTADQLAKKPVAELEAWLLLHSDGIMLSYRQEFRDYVRALAKQGEAYEEALAHARSLYRDGQQPTTAELAEKLNASRDVLAPENPWEADGARALVSELVKRGFGHVPVESFAAAMTTLEQAEKERDEALIVARCEKDRADANHEMRLERDRLAAALNAIAVNAESWHGDNEAKGRALTVIAGWARDPDSIPRAVLDALASQEQTT